jgi:hypothetical protein
VFFLKLVIFIKFSKKYFLNFNFFFFLLLLLLLLLVTFKLLKLSNLKLNNKLLVLPKNTILGFFLFLKLLKLVFFTKLKFKKKGSNFSTFKLLIFFKFKLFKK